MSAYGDVSCDLCGIRYYELDRHFCKDEDVALCVATLRTRAERAEAELDEAFKMSRCECGADECCANLVRACQETLAAQSTIADLTGQVERLREALTKVRPWFTPETMIGAGMIKIVDAALGGEKSTAPAFTLPPETPPPE